MKKKQEIAVNDVLIEWVSTFDRLPPYNEHILGIDERGFIVQTRRFQMWDRHWIPKSGKKTKWQYWAKLPAVPKDVRKSYDT